MITPTAKIITIPHSKLVPNPKNRTVQRCSSNTRRRAESIKSLNILQNIVVTPLPDGRYRIEAGNGRYESVQLLIDEGAATEDFPYPALVAEDANLSSLIKLAENGNRDNLHPVDEFMAYQEAVTLKLPIKEIANTNGVTVKHVKQRLRLAALSPVILDALRSNVLSIESAEAFTLTDDLERQEHVFNALSEWQYDRPHCIRQLILNEKVTNSHRLALFVSQKDYKRAGGQITTSLFDETIVFEQPEILIQLAKEKLETAASAITGWKWVEVVTDTPINDLYQKTNAITPIGRDTPAAISKEKEALISESNALESQEEELTDEEDARLQAIWERLDEIDDIESNFDVYDPTEMAFSGCIVGVGDKGEVHVVKGRIKAEDAKELAQAARSTRDDNDAVGASLETHGGAGDSGYSQALADDLALTRVALIQAQLAAAPELAYDLGVFTLADSLLRTQMAGWCPSATSMTVNACNLEDANAGALEELEKAKRRLNLSWIKGTGEERFKGFKALTREEKDSIFAFCVARGIQPHLSTSRSLSPALAETTQELKPNYRKGWTPDRNQFFKRLKLDQLLAIGAEIFGEAWKEGNATAQKKDIVDALGNAFQGDASLPDDVNERIALWVPAGF